MLGVVSYKFEYKLGNEADYKLGKEITSSKNSCNYTYIDLTQEVVNNLKVTATDNKGNSKESTLDVTPDVRQPMNPEITDMSLAGKVVNYTPKAGQVYNISTTYCGYHWGADFSSSDYSGTWSIWGTDNNYIYILSTTVTSLSLPIMGATGYNNGVTLLDELCDACFTDKTTYPGSKGQNLKLEQVLAVKGTNISNSAENEYGTQPYTYNFLYPYIWNEHEKSNVSGSQGSNNWEKNKSKAYTLTTVGETNTTISAKPYYSLWYNEDMNKLSAWKNAAYYDLVMSPAQNTLYFLSSRYVKPREYNYCEFGLQCVSSGGVTTLGFIYESRLTGGAANFNNLPARPIISFPRSMYELEEQADGSYNIVAK